MADFFSTRSSDDIFDNYETNVSYLEYEHSEEDSDVKTHLIISGVEDPDYQHIQNQIFFIPTERFESHSGYKAKVEVTEYKGTEQAEIRFIDFIN